MKDLIITLFLLVSFINHSFSQSPGEIFLNKNKLVGNCDDPYFSGFEIELDSVYSRIDSLTLFNNLPRLGILNFKNSVRIPTEFTITNRAGYPQMMFRFKSEWHTFDNLIFTDQSISFSVNRDPEVPPTKSDLQIVRLAKRILSEEKNWNKKDDRNCEDDLANKCYSLYCALKTASLEIDNHYNHRNAVLQKLRHLIEEKHPTKNWNHRLMYFSNMEETSYQTVMEILDEIETDFIQKIKESED